MYKYLDRINIIGGSMEAAFDFTIRFDPQLFEQKFASDGILSRDGQGLRINSEKYTHHIPLAPSKPGLNLQGEHAAFDHIKWLTLVAQSFTISETELLYTGVLSAQQILSPEIVPACFRSRIRNIYEDHRLCCSGLVIYGGSNVSGSNVSGSNVSGGATMMGILFTN